MLSTPSPGTAETDGPHERVRALRTAQRIPLREFSDRMEALRAQNPTAAPWRDVERAPSPATLSRFESGEGLKQDGHLHLMAAVLGVPYEHLRYGEHGHHARPAPRLAPLVQVAHIPIAARATFAEAMVGGGLLDPGAWDTVSIYLNPGELLDIVASWYCLDVNGDSMEPTLQHGQQVLVERVPEAKWGLQSTGVYVVAFEDMVVVKRISKNDLDVGGGLLLTSDNPRGGQMTVARASIRSMWRVKRLAQAPEIY
ncbi:LexA family transcriptional regulator [Hymenobacter latericus]|uniref:LexA family transcriptional regulator n=1 Tax=Hymenobacter sp. YIM 151858-1 TaxID=2987688 RepID=UPI002225B86E|nr:LexA family transcriptional regulator [Hymenobacter sp. YIM 151858-1]UYZ60172.1 LexA family transcriptional regulator [Hymenobacter sp. YIM 151858-1]